MKTHCYVKSFLNSWLFIVLKCQHSYSCFMQISLLLTFTSVPFQFYFSFYEVFNKQYAFFIQNIIITLNLYFFLFLSFSCHGAKPFISRCWFTVYYNNTHVPKDDTDDKTCVNGYHSKNRLILLLNSI